LPIRYRVASEIRCIFTVAEGNLTDDELLEHAQAVEKDPEVDPQYDEVVDLRAVKGFGPSLETMREAAQILRSGPRGAGRIAIVAPSDAGFGSGRMFEGLSGGDTDRVRAFRSADEAYAWLGIGPPDTGE
jgi:hypothetical protein